MKKLSTIIILLLVFISGIALFRFFSNSSSDAQSKIVFIGPVTVECVGLVPQRCIQIKESPEANWENFYGSIEGFTHETGYEYTLSVIEETIENPPEDASSKKLTINNILEQKEVPYIAITTPKDGNEIPANKTFTISGTGRGLFENNVIIQIGSEIDMINDVITTMETEEIGGEGTWKVETSIEGMVPNDENISGKISAYSPSPKEGDTGLRYTIPVMYVNNNN